MISPSSSDKCFWESLCVCVHKCAQVFVLWLCTAGPIVGCVTCKQPLTSGYAVSQPWHRRLSLSLCVPSMEWVGQRGEGKEGEQRSKGEDGGEEEAARGGRSVAPG